MLFTFGWRNNGLRVRGALEFFENLGLRNRRNGLSFARNFRQAVGTSVEWLT